MLGQSETLVPLSESAAPRLTSNGSPGPLLTHRVSIPQSDFCKVWAGCCRSPYTQWCPGVKWGWVDAPAQDLKGMELISVFHSSCLLEFQVFSILQTVPGESLHITHVQFQKRPIQHSVVVCGDTESWGFLLQSSLDPLPLKSLDTTTILDCVAPKHV